jgi:hypothetical protein
MKTSTTSPRKPRKTSSTSAAKATPAEKKVAAPRVRRTAPKTTAASDTSAPVQPTPTVDDVRFRAYEIYLQRNGYGDELSDWLQAEQELLA